MCAKLYVCVQMCARVSASVRVRVSVSACVWHVHTSP